MAWHALASHALALLCLLRVIVRSALCVPTVAQVIDIDGEMSEETVYEVQVEPKDASASDSIAPLNLVCHTH
jgi:hypothetical protein